VRELPWARVRPHRFQTRIRDAAHSHLLRAGKPEAYRQAIFDSLYRAMRDTLMCPKTTSS
jgi:hypothetical protein